LPSSPSTSKHPPAAPWTPAGCLPGQRPMTASPRHHLPTPLAAAGGSGDGNRPAAAPGGGWSAGHPLSAAAGCGPKQWPCPGGCGWWF
jgi:hypothetical protein